jgi:hypothetical protein
MNLAIILEHDHATDFLHTLEIEPSDAGDSVVIYDQCDEADRTRLRQVEIPLEHVAAVAAALVRVARGMRQ